MIEIEDLGYGILRITDLRYTIDAIEKIKHAWENIGITATIDYAIFCKSDFSCELRCTHGDVDFIGVLESLPEILNIDETEEVVIIAIVVV